VVILGAALLHSRLTRDAPADIIAELTAEHARAVGEAHIASSDHAGVATWLARHVHFGAQVPVLPGATLRGARISVFDGRPSAVLEYDVAGTAMSYFMIPNERGSADASSAVRFDQTARAGYRVISWREPGLLHAMVGNLSPPQLLALAKACVEQARRGVA
jgi:anti-sigma factor RsiW